MKFHRWERFSRTFVSRIQHLLGLPRWPIYISGCELLWHTHTHTAHVMWGAHRYSSYWDSST